MPPAPSKRLLLLIPTSTYRTEDFMEAAGRLDVDLVVASEKPNVMAGEFPDHLLTLPGAEAEDFEQARGVRGRLTHLGDLHVHPGRSGRLDEPCCL